MMASHAVGIIVLVAVTAGWVGVQLAWRRTFPEVGSDPDVLVGRGGCGGCREKESCETATCGHAGDRGEKENR